MRTYLAHGYLNLCAMKLEMNHFATLSCFNSSATKTVQYDRG